MNRAANFVLMGKVIALAFALALSGCNPWPTETSLGQTKSPGGKTFARVIFTDPGSPLAPSSMHTDVLVRSTNNLINPDCLVFRGWGLGDERVKLRWQDMESLIIEHDFDPDDVEVSPECQSFDVTSRAMELN